MEYSIVLNFQKCLYLNVYIYIVWVVVNSYFLFIKVLKLEHLSRYLSITVFVLLTVIEFVRLYLGHYGNLSSRVPELAGFLMLTVLMQIPLVTFFLFNPYLLSTPTEFVLHACLWITTLIEIVYCFLALKKASSQAKSMYISQSKDSVFKY